LLRALPALTRYGHAAHGIGDATLLGGVKQVAAQAIGIDSHLHDLPRTFATTATRHGIDGSTLKRLMNHSTGSDVTARHYVKFRLNDLRPAMQNVEA
jgi:hypothetical protein